MCIEPKQDSKQEPSTFALIVDRLRYMNEAELKLAYVKLLGKNWKKNGKV
ncbi:MAG: hypothetical protein ACTHLE_10445 [Agriterribacter sp.]